MDIFDFFRYVLGTVATIYATVVTVQSLWGWYVYLTGPDKYMTLIRRYVIVHGLRLRFRAFWGDVIVSLLLCVAFMLMMRAHWQIERLGEDLARIHSTNNTDVSRSTQQH